MVKNIYVKYKIQYDGCHIKIPTLVLTLSGNKLSTPNLIRL